MNSSQFHEVTQKLGSLGRQVAALPTDVYLEDLRRDEAFGCFVDSPIAWSSRRKICEALVRLAEAARAFGLASEAADDVAMKNIVDEGMRRAEAKTP